MELVKQEIIKDLKKLGVTNPRIESPRGVDSDLAFPCFELAKEKKRNPKELAEELASKSKPKFVKEVKAIGPYLNYYIDWSTVGQKLLESVDDKYGSSKSKENVIMDVYQANPFKSFHIGHVRNAVFGESVRRLLEFGGRKTTTVTYNGDVGTHVAKWLWHYHKFYKGTIPKKNFSKWVGEIYAKASEKVKESPGYEEEVKEVNRKLDKRDPSLTKDWEKIRQLCYDDYSRIAKELGIKVDHNIPESTCEEPGKKKVIELRKEGKIIESEGTLGIDLKKYDLGFFMLLKSDGTALYSTKDFGLLTQKSKLGDFDKYLYVVGSEQEFYFKQLFKSYEALKMPHAGKHHHVSHGLVTLKEGKMASRLGNVILYEDLRDETVKMVLEKMKDSKLKNIEEISRQVAFGAIKFSMLNVENHKLIKFDWDQALDFNGRSGPYIQYTYVRTRGILEGQKIGRIDASLLKEESEINLMKKLSQFPHIVSRSAEEYSPYLVANYLFELSQEFNQFYQSVSVLKSEDEVKRARLLLVKSVSHVLKTGLWLLGIESPEKM